MILRKMKILDFHKISYILVSIDTVIVGVAGFEPATSCSQSRRDDRATLHPEVYFLKIFAERQGFEPWRRLPVDRLAICSITTLAPLLGTFTFFSKRGCKCIFYQSNYQRIFTNKSTFLQSISPIDIFC